MAIPLLILRRLGAMIPILVTVTFIVFCLVLIIPGDPAVTLAGENPSPELLAEIRQEMGLDKSAAGQYWDWASAAAQGDLGHSLNTSRAVSDAIRAALPVTLSLTFLAFMIGCTGGMILGFLSGVRPGSALDRLATLGFSAALAMPSFWLALVLISTFAINRSWFPVGQYVPFSESPWGWFHHLILPAMALSASVVAEVARQSRSAMIDSMNAEFTRTARSKGLGPMSVATKHAFRNAALPTINVIGLQFNRLFSGAVVIEAIFILPGIGRLAITAVRQNDLRMIQGIVVLSAILVLFVNLLVDIISAWLNPRIRQA